RGVFLALVAFFLATFALSFLDGAKTHPVIGGVLRFEERIEAAIRRVIPTKVGGRDVARWFVVVPSILLAGAAGRSVPRFRHRADVLGVKAEYAKLRSTAKLAGSSPIFSPLDEALAGGTRTSREEL